MDPYDSNHQQRLRYFRTVPFSGAQNSNKPGKPGNIFSTEKNENSLFFQNQSSSGLQSKVTNRKENQKMNDPICCLVNINGNQKPKQTKRYHGNI